MYNRDAVAPRPQRLPALHFSNPRKFFWSILALVILLTGSTAYAELATAEQAQNVCTNWLSMSVSRWGGWAGVGNPTIMESGVVEANGVALARYYNIAPDGFVVVPLLMEMSPVKMYSEQGHLDMSDTDGMVQMLREVLELRHRDYVDAFGDASAVQPSGDAGMFAPEHRDAWRAYAVSTKDFRIDQALSIENVGPLLTSSWSQGSPYNNDCPIGQSGLCVVGCTATATSQILKYWEWPTAGFGSHSYLWAGDNSCGGTPTAPTYLSADYSDPYDWASMRDSCDDGLGCNATQQAALAELNHEVGVVVNMKYGSCGSGASAQCALGRIPLHFKYDWGIGSACRKDYDLDGWFQVIQDEINAGRVIQYGITSHSIVCDGWRTDGVTHEFHMNYGWGQGNNAWYVLDNLSCSWESGGICTSIVENMIIGIQPEISSYLSYRGVIQVESVGDGDGYADPGETIQLSPIIRNLGWDITNTSATLTTADTYVTLTDGTAAYKTLLTRGQWDTTATALALEIAPGCPDPHIIELTLHVTEDGGFAADYEVQIGVGDVPGFEDDMEGPESYFTHRALTDRLVDQWHLEDYRRHAGSYSWKCGSAGAVGYSDGADAGLITPPFTLSPGSQLEFWYYMDAESGLPTNSAWDGGIVMISEDGMDWTKLMPVGGYPYNNTGTDSEVQFEAWSGLYSGTVGWTEENFDLSGYSGKVQLMFRFGADGGAHEEGWYIDDVWVGNTPSGTDIGVTPAPGFDLMFGTVSERGDTWAEVSPTGPALPESFASVPALSPQFCDVVTTATFSGVTQVTASYNEEDLQGPESDLALLIYVGDSWQNITLVVNQAQNSVTGLAYVLGPMILVEPSGCCADRVGDTNGAGGDEPTIGDVSVLIDALFIGGNWSIIPCLAEADINLSGGAEPVQADITIGDVSYLIDYLFITGDVLGLPDCP